MAFAERRKYPRVFESIPCRIGVGPSGFPAQTTNLSCGGALCRLPKALPAMTKLNVLLHLSLKNNNPQKIQCAGVVVRQDHQLDPAGQPSYLTAIYFSDIKVEDRRKIGEFVLQSMLSHDRRRS